MITIDEYSISTLPIEMHFNETLISIGTACIWQENDDYFLITNWHNLSGRAWGTGKHLSKTAAEPNRLRVWWHHNGSLGNRYIDYIDIRDSDGKALWWIHPELGPAVDVVALPIRQREETKLFPINRMHRNDLALRVGMDVFILGYPFGFGPAAYPIWKRGSIASEPEVRNDDQRFILVDSASRPGMSGSPVIRRSWGTHFLSGGGVEMNTGTATMFVGIYSGRLTTTDPSDPQLGITWPASFVHEIVLGRKADES